MEYLFGKNVVFECLKANRRDLHELFLSSENEELEPLAHDKGVKITHTTRSRLDNMVPDGRHQGAVISVGAKPVLVDIVGDMLMDLELL